MKDPKKTITDLIAEAKHTHSINGLLDISQRIAGGLVYFATLETEAFRGYNEAYFARKNFEAMFVKKSDESASKAKELAVVESKELREAEADMEAAHKEYQIFRIAVTQYLESLRQKISFLKQEQQTQKQTT